jgi:osmotically-inducible protein OsmY
MRTDLQLVSDVTEELKWEPSVKAKEIGVAVRESVVTLSGNVDTFGQKFAAERAAERVTGVRAVADELKVKLPNANERTDTELALAVVHAFKWDVEVPDDQIKCKVVNGWLTLEGSVEWYFQKAAAERDVRFLMGVKGVMNLIDVKPKASASDVMTHIEKALKRTAELDAKKVRVDARGGKVTLRGSVRSWAERQEAERAAWATSGVTEVVDKIEIEA